MKPIDILSLLLRVLAAVILLQTLYFKFSAHPESVELFSKLGVEPWGRIATGVIELITGVLLLTNRFKLIGAIFSLGLMVGAIFFHLTIIGIESKGDGGLLFTMAIIVFLSSLILIWLHRQQGLAWLKLAFPLKK